MNTIDGLDAKANYKTSLIAHVVKGECVRGTYGLLGFSSQKPNPFALTGQYNNNN